MTRSIQVCCAPWPRSLSSRAVIRGVRVSDTSPEARMATTMVTANSRKMRPTRPDMNTSGMNTAASDTVIETMVKLIWRALVRVAWSAFSPSSMRRTVFSRNTMASSTRKPMARVSAIRVRLFRLYPSARIATNVRSSDNGSATAGIRVSRARPRKTKITRTTRVKAMSRVSCTSATELTMDRERS